MELLRRFQEAVLMLQVPWWQKAIHADIYENWTDVSGFLVTDPRIVENPAVIETITYGSFESFLIWEQLFFMKMQSFRFVKKGIPINIRNTNRPEDKGTFIVESTCRKPKYVDYRYCRKKVSVRSILKSP